MPAKKVSTKRSSAAKTAKTQYLTIETLDKYLKENLVNYLYPENKVEYTVQIDLIQRLVTLEEEIKNQGKRIEQDDRRFSSMQWFMATVFTMLVVLLSVYQFLS